MAADGGSRAGHVLSPRPSPHRVPLVRAPLSTPSPRAESFRPWAILSNHFMVQEEHPFFHAKSPLRLTHRLPLTAY
jgi:hypothetical protein